MAVGASSAPSDPPPPNCEGSIGEQRGGLGETEGWGEGEEERGRKKKEAGLHFVENV